MCYDSLKYEEQSMFAVTQSELSAASGNNRESGIIIILSLQVRQSMLSNLSVARDGYIFIIMNRNSRLFCYDMRRSSIHANRLRPDYGFVNVEDSNKL